MDYYGEPAAPPRRKRSLSTSRFDSPHFSRSQDSGSGSYFGFGNRMRHNFSTEHIPNSYHQQQQQQTDLRGLYSPINSRPTNPTARAGYSPGQQPVSQQIPGFVNPYAVSQLSPTRAPNRPHFDYQKCGPNLNVQYNPYQSKFNPTLMARPNIEPFQSTAIQTSIANAIARGRTPNLYSSKEQLYQTPNYGEQRTPPERPPPPRLSRLSVENLSSMDPVDRRDRRSMTPTRQIDQKAYGTRRSTSPLSNLSTSGNLSPSFGGGNISPSFVGGNPLSRSTSGSHLLSSSPTNRYQTQLSGGSTGSPTYNSNHNLLYRGSRESSPMRISREASPVRHYSCNSPSNSTYAAPNRPTSLQSKYSRSAILGVHSIPSKKECGRVSPNQPSTPLMGYDSRNLDTLQVPSIDGSPQQQQQQQHSLQNRTCKDSDPVFSNLYTDRCDQYKSVTSKILCGKKANRKSGDFGDVNLDNEMEASHSPIGQSATQFTTAAPPSSDCDPYQQHQQQLLQQQQQQQQSRMSREPTPTPSIGSGINGGGFQPAPNDAPFPIEQTKKLSMLGGDMLNIRRASSSNGLSAQQRKGSLPSDYIAAAAVNGIKLSSEWSRENVASMAHEARLRQKNPGAGRTQAAIRNIGAWFTRQFIFLLIAAFNILIAYVFYNLLVMLPKD